MMSSKSICGGATRLREPPDLEPGDLRGQYLKQDNRNTFRTNQKNTHTHTHARFEKTVPNNGTYISLYQCL